MFNGFTMQQDIDGLSKSYNVDAEESILVREQCCGMVVSFVVGI